VAHSFYRDILGVRELDAQKKLLRLKIADVGLDWCEGKLMTPQGPLAVRWWKDKGRTLCHVDLPAGYVLQNESPGGSVTIQ
jgi:alpha-L-rhamnosidase